MWFLLLDEKNIIIKEGEFFWQRKAWTQYEFQRHNGDHLRRERRELWREKRKVRIFGKGNCKLIGNFSVTMVTSLPSLSLSLSLSLFSLSLSVSLSLSLSLSLFSHRAHRAHNIGSASALLIIPNHLSHWTHLEVFPKIYTVTGFFCQTHAWKISP